MTNAWTLVTASSLNLVDVETVVIDDGKGDIRIIKPADMERALSAIEITPLRSPDFTIWTFEYVWTPERHGTPIYLEKRARLPEVWATDRTFYPVAGTPPVEDDIKARQAIADLSMMTLLEEDRLEILDTAPVLVPAEEGDPLFTIGLIRVDGETVEVMQPDGYEMDGNVDLSLLKRLSLYDNAARNLRRLLELKQHLSGAS